MPEFLPETAIQRWALSASCCLFLLVLAGGVDAQEPDWKTGDPFFRAARARGLNGVWQGAELYGELMRTSRAAGLCVVIDRRIDPGQLVAVQMRDASFEQLLWDAGDSVGAGVGELESCFYLGPAATALALPERTVELRELAGGRTLPASARRALLRTVAAKTEDWVEPGMFFRELSESEGLSIEGWEQVPLDVWSAIDWPAMPLGDCLTLALAGFDLQLAAGDDKSLVIVPCARLPAFRRKVSRDLIDAPLARQLDAIAGLTARRQGNGWLLEGDAAALVAAGRLVASAGMGQAGSSDQSASEVRLTLSTRARRRDLLAAIASQQRLKLELADTSFASLDDLVPVEAVNVTLAELVALVLKDSGLVGEVREGALRIERK